MKCTFVILAALCICNGVKSQDVFGSFLNTLGKTVRNVFSRDPCKRDHLHDFRNAISAFSTDSFKRAAIKGDGHFVISPLSIWISLASLAEAADDSTKLEYFNILNLPTESCVRNAYYQIALGLEQSNTDVKLQMKRLMIFANNVNLNPKWVDYVNNMKFLNLRRENGNSTKARTPKLTGNSLLYDTLYYNAFWTTAFPNADIKREPFFDDDTGKQIGTVDLMRMRQRVKLAHLPILKAKALELPVGFDGRYSMLISMGMQSTTARRLLQLYKSSIIVDILNSLIMSPIPIDIAIPKFTAFTQHDAREILEEIGLKSVWYNPAATKYISEPAAMPTNYIQQVNVEIGPIGIKQGHKVSGSLLSVILEAPSQAATKFLAKLGRDFIANKPFLYSLIDKKTSTILFTGSFSKGEPN